MKINQEPSRKDNSVITSMTNRNFYVRYKKSPESMMKPNLKKVIKVLAKKENNSISMTKAIRQNTFTQPFQNLSLSTNLCLEKKRKIESLLKTMDASWKKLFIAFTKSIQSQSIESLQINQLDFYEIFYELVANQLQKKRKQKSFNCQLTKSNTSFQNAVALENARLQKQNCMLKEQFISDRSSKLEKQQNSKIERKEEIVNTLKNIDLSNNKTLQNKIVFQEQEILILKKQIDLMKEQFFSVKQEKKSLFERICDLKESNQNLCAQVVSLEIKNKSTRAKNQAIMMMQKQEIQSYQRQVFDMRKMFFNLNKKYKGLLTKFKKISTSSSYTIKSLNNKEAKKFAEQFKAFQEVKIKFSQFIKINLETKDVFNYSNLLNTKGIYQSYLDEYETLNNREAIKKKEKKYKISQYLLPSFYTLIQEDINFFGIDRTNYEHYNEEISLDFIAKMRAILDSAFNNFCFNKPLKSSTIRNTICSFPTFVLSWLNKFQIDGKKKNVQKIETINRQSICTFYANLMSSSLNNSWEVVSFREFLFESFGLDELYFYLRIRNKVLEGPISQNIDFAFEELYYLDYGKTSTTLIKFIREEDVSFKRTIEELLKNSIIFIRKKSYIDLHYILRIMLQYYQTVKENQFDKILKTCETYLYGKKNNLEYIEFMKIFQYHFSFLSLTEKIELFRLCYCVGNGNISLEIIFSVLNQQGIFVRWIEANLFLNQVSSIKEVKKETIPTTQNKLVKMTSLASQCESFIESEQNNNFQRAVPNFAWLAQSEKQLMILIKTHIKQEISSFGVEYLNQFFAKNISSKYSILPRFEEYIKICFTIAQQRCELGKSDKDHYEEIAEIVPLTIQYLTNLSKLTLQKNQIKKLIYNFKLEGASSAIKNFYNKKKTQMTRSLLHTYTKNSIENKIKNDKSTLIRQEFVNIIESMKKPRKQRKGSSRKILE